jgi:hypothetical protein
MFTLAVLIFAAWLLAREFGRKSGEMKKAYREKIERENKKIDVNQNLIEVQEKSLEAINQLIELKQSELLHGHGTHENVTQPHAKVEQSGYRTLRTKKQVLNNASAQRH